MPPNKPDTSFFVPYTVVLAVQLPVWLLGGLIWTGLMILMGSNPAGVLYGGLFWGLFMWVLMGNLFAIGLAWRRSTKFIVADRTAFRDALERVCGKLRLIVLNETNDRVILGPKRVLVRFSLQESRIAFANGKAILTANALLFGRIRKALKRELSQSTLVGDGNPEANHPNA
jgi:hypothetical protein